MKIGMLLLSLTPVLAADPTVGTWKRDTTKSVTAGTTTRGETIVVEGRPNGAVWHNYMKKANSPDVHAISSVTYDGKLGKLDFQDQVVGERLYETVSVKRIDDYNYEWTLKGPRAKTIRKILVSSDGKTMTFFDKRETSDGRILDLKYFYTKQ